MQIGTAEQEALFDIIPDVVYFAKDREGRYTSVNETLVMRCGKQHKRELLGKTPLDLFPAPLAEAYVAQDQRVVRSGEPIVDRLELHLFAGPDLHGRGYARPGARRPSARAGRGRPRPTDCAEFGMTAGESLQDLARAVR